MPLPVASVTPPAVLAGQTNGRLSDSILVVTKGLNGSEAVTLVKPAALAWVAMTAAALKDGIVLTVTDSYREYAEQERIFRERYTTTRLAGRPSRQWNGRTWWQRPGTAAAAVPGTSNHGRGLALDMRLAAGVLDWLLRNAARFGFSWEIQSEAWHIRYVAGDRLPDAVAAHTGPIAPPQEDGFLMALTPDEQQEVLAAARQSMWPPGTPAEGRHRLWDLALWGLAQIDPAAFAVEVAKHLDGVAEADIEAAVRKVFADAGT